jgi:phage/plasmid primase-like uncharacterized protein
MSPPDTNALEEFLAGNNPPPQQPPAAPPDDDGDPVPGDSWCLPPALVAIDCFYGIAETGGVAGSLAAAAAWRTMAEHGWVRVDGDALEPDDGAGNSAPPIENERQIKGDSNTTAGNSALGDDAAGQATPADLATVLQALLGEPTERGGPYWRFGTKGGLRVHVPTGKWIDFSTGQRGQIAALVMRERNCNADAAAQWLAASNFTPMDPAQIAAREQADEKRKRKRQSAVKKQATELLAVAEGLFKRRPELTRTQEYLRAKGLDHIDVARYGLTVIGKSDIPEWKAAHKLAGGHCLILPMRDHAGDVHNVQLIDRIGRKLFMWGGRAAGLFFLIDDGDLTTLVIAEGLATGISIHEATGYPVAVVFSAGNIAAVARWFVEHGSRVVIAADDDWSKATNVGRETAIKVSRQLRCAVALPAFPADRYANEKDFNDLSRRPGGDDTIREIFRKALEPPRPDEPPAAPDGGWQDGSNTDYERGDPRAKNDARAERKRNPLPFTLAKDLREDEDKEWMLEDWLGLDEISAFYGPPEAGKSTIVVDIGGHVAAGLEWNGKRVHQCGVLYCAVERAAITRRRLRAWIKENKDRLIAHGVAALPFAIVDADIDLRTNQVDAWRVIDTAETLGKIWGQLPGWVIFDTYNAVMAGGDEGPRDTALVTRNVELIYREIKSHTSAVAHTPVDRNDRIRGFGGLNAKLTTTIRITKPEKGQVLLEVDKGNDLADGEKPRLAFAFKPVFLRKHPRTGKDITAPVIVSQDLEPAALKATTKPGRPKQKAPHILARRALANALCDLGVTPPIAAIPAGYKAVTIDQWRNQAFKDGFKIGEKPNTRRVAFQRVTETMQVAGEIGISGDWIWLLSPSKPEEK